MSLPIRWEWMIVAGIAVSMTGCTRLEQHAQVAMEEPAPPAPAAPGSLGTQGMTGGAGPPARLALAASKPAHAAANLLTIAAIADSRPERYLIKNATLTIEVPDARRASASLLAAVRAVGGYLSDAEESVDELGRRSSTIKARVPFAQFDRALGEIDALGKVVEKQISAEDVTEEFVDSQARLRNLKRTELRLLEHLNRTARLADVLLVEKELNRVRGEIEQLEGRLRFLAHRVAFSTVAVTLTETPRKEQMVPTSTYSSGKQFSEAVRSLVAFGRALWTVAIWIGIWVVVWLPLSLAGWLAHRRWRPAAAG